VKFFILFCGIFSPKRSPLKHWEKYEPVFVKLLAKNCRQNVAFWQAIVLFFMRFYPQIAEQASTFCKILWERDILTSDFFKNWSNQQSNGQLLGMKDIQAETEMKQMLA